MTEFTRIGAVFGGLLDDDESRYGRRGRNREAQDEHYRCAYRLGENDAFSEDWTASALFPFAASIPLLLRWDGGENIQGGRRAVGGSLRVHRGSSLIPIFLCSAPSRTRHDPLRRNRLRLRQDEEHSHRATETIEILLLRRR